MNERRAPSEAETVDRRQRLRERLRAEWIAGAEDEWRLRTGQATTTDELERVVRRHVGDV